MTEEAFLKTFSKLAAAFPEYYRKTRAETISKTVANLPAEWFDSKADAVIASGDPKFNWGAEASAYIKQQAQDRASKKFWEEIEQSRKNCTAEGLPQALKPFGAQSLWEAVEKAKGKGA